MKISTVDCNHSASCTCCPAGNYYHFSKRYLQIVRTHLSHLKQDSFPTFVTSLVYDFEVFKFTAASTCLITLLL